MKVCMIVLQVMAAVPKGDRRVVFCVVGDFNSHQADWLSSAW